jgi:hypothetical protein
MEMKTNTSICFPNDTKVAEYSLTHKGCEVFKGTEDHCYMKLQRCQSQSAGWAIQNDGWKVEPTGREIDDPKITVTVLQDVKWMDSKILFEYRGNRYWINKNAAYGYGTFTAGQTVDVDSAYAYPAE